MSFSIIPAVAADAQVLAQLINSAYRGDSSRKGWTTEADLLDGTRTDAALLQDLMAKADTVLLKYVEGDAILGCVELRKEHKKLYLGMLTVSPGLQNKGVGKKLLFAAEDYAVSIGCTAVFMRVISVRYELIAWYERHGYQLTGARQPFAFSDPRMGYPKMDLEFVLLEKTLSALQ